MTDRKHQLDGLAVASLIGCCAFWGLQQILIKTTVPEVPVAVVRAAPHPAVRA
jgi:hypothetical protein